MILINIIIIFSNNLTKSIMNEKQIKLNNFMSWCNTKLLKCYSGLVAEFIGNKIYITKLENRDYFTTPVMSDVIEVADEMKLHCFFIQKEGNVQIEII